MVIDNETHRLSENNYIPVETNKTQILLGNTFSTGMDHMVAWKTRINGKNKRTAAFTIDLRGKVYQHYDPKFYTLFTGFERIDKIIIPVVLVNEGYLAKDLLNNVYYDWIGDIYKRKAEVVEKRWRNQAFWATYTKAQLNSSVELIKHLCEQYDIPLETVGHNTKVDTQELIQFKGVTFKSNYFREYLDLSPAFNYEEFKNKLK